MTTDQVRFALSEEAVRLNVKPPSQGYPGEDAGFDLRSLHDHFVPPSTAVDIPTGVHFEIPNNLFGLVCARTSMAKKGLITLYQVVDPGFVGELTLRLFNTNERVPPLLAAGQPYPGWVSIAVGDRVAQIVFIPYWGGALQQVTVRQLKKTARGAGREGSTGR